jgi:putative methyltransferase (TIGR04325 family)
MIGKLKNTIKDKLNRPGWYGNYSSWDDALKDSSGYNSALIVEKVKDSLLRVKRGEAAFERDSVAFDKMEYVWPVLSGLLWIAARKKGSLNVVDFGGSLGSTYFQYRKFLADIQVKWTIVEQDIFVRCGKEYFEDSNLSFCLTIDECRKENSPDVVLLSSVLPYLREPYAILMEIMNSDPPFMIFDKMPFLLDDHADLITVQRVHPSIYEASYPAWFFNKGKFLATLETKYELVEEFDSAEKANLPSVFKGFIFRHRNRSTD